MQLERMKPMSEINGYANGNGTSTGRFLQWMVPILAALSVIAGAIVSISSLEATVSNQQARLASLESNYNLMAEREILLRTTIATMTAKMLEIDTQLCSEDHIRNLTQAQNLRFLSMIWKKVFPDSDVPAGDTYYPTVCNRSGETPFGGGGAR
jgi:hypothetical protein